MLRYRQRAFALSATLGLGVLWPMSPAVAQAEEGLSSQGSAKASVVTGEGVRAYRDAETGMLRGPTAEERARIAPGQVRKEDQGKAKVPLTVVRAKNGTLSAVVGTRALDALVARRDADGKLVIRHASEESQKNVSASVPAGREDH